MMFLEPKALLRVKRRGADPRRARATTRQLSKMIDAPARRPLASGSRSGPTLEAYTVPIGKGEDRPRGRRSVTVVSYGRTLPLCAQGRRRSSRDEGIDAEVIDLRTLWPYDWELITRAVAEDRPRAVRQRGHRGDELRRAPAPPHGRRALLRAARSAAAARRASSSPASGWPIRWRWRRFRSCRTSPRRCAALAREQP